MRFVRQNLPSSDYRGALRIMEQVARCGSLGEFSAVALKRSLEYLGAQSGVFFLYNPAQQKFSWGNGESCNLSNDFHSEYVKSFSDQDPVINYLNSASSHCCDPVVRLEDIVDYGQLESSPYYQEFLCRGSIHHVMVLLLRTESNQIGLAGLHRSKSEQSFSLREVGRAQVLSALLSTKLDRWIIQEKLEKADKVLGILESGMENQALLLFDAHFEPIYVSPLAQRRFDADSVNMPGRVQVSDELIASLHKSAQMMRESQRPHMLFRIRIHAAQFTIRLECRRLRSGQVIWMANLLDAESGSVNEASRAQLTKRQREIAQLVSTGLTNKEISRRLDISVKTVENHLHSIYDQLGVNSRTMLVHVMNQKHLPFSSG